MSVQSPRRPDLTKTAVDELSVHHHQHAMYDLVIEELQGRRIRIGDHWLTDFASCNYLGLDLDEQVIASIEPAVRRWGTHPSWSRFVGNPRPYLDIEDRLTGLLGAPDTLVLPTITHIHLSVLPVLAAQGQLFMDARAHRTIYDGCHVAVGAGAKLIPYRHHDLDHLRAKLRAAPVNGPRVIVTDGVNSMTGNMPLLPELAALAREYDALLYVDDAHGFGVIGERTPEETSDYGSRGNSIVRYYDESYDNVILVGGFSKAYSSLLAFLALPTVLKERLKVATSPYIYSGPSPVASLATVLAGFDVNAERGDQLRLQVHQLTHTVLDHLTKLGIGTSNTSGLPIIQIPAADPDDLPALWQSLFDHGVYSTAAAYPVVPRKEVGLRIQLTAANTPAEIDELCAVLTAHAHRFKAAV